MNPDAEQGLPFVSAGEAADRSGGAFVAVARTAEELAALLGDPSPDLQWIQVEGLLANAEVWQSAAQGSDGVPLDVVVPASSFADLYRLVDVRNSRDVRVTIQATPGFPKAVRLAASLGFYVRILPGQPIGETLAELEAVAEFYLHDPMVQAPIEYFHSALASGRGFDGGSLWEALEEDPAVFRRLRPDGSQTLPRSGRTLPDSESADAFVADWIAELVASGAECATCRWRTFCQGYFKWPDRDYDCGGAKRIFAAIDATAAEIAAELASREGADG